MSSDILSKATELIKASKKAEAQRLLEPLLKTDPHNIPLWARYIETYPTLEQRIRALEQCLYHNPDNGKIKRVQLLSSPAAPQVSP